MDCFAGIEAFEGVDWDAGLVDDLLQCHHSRPIRFYTPGFKTYSTSELPSCGKRSWPAVSITGANCSLRCDHCRGRILESMIPATSPGQLWEVASRHAQAGGEGMLLSGGSNSHNEVEYGPFLATLGRIKEAWPEFRIAVHTGLVDEKLAVGLARAGVDVAMMDLVGAPETIRQVYHLRRQVADFEDGLAHLLAAGLTVVPHIVVGLHYGRLLGEQHALAMATRHRPHALVLVVAMPQYADSRHPFVVPEPVQVGRFFQEARAAFTEAPLLLGCARPPGKVKTAIDAYAVLAGLDGLAHPAEGVVTLARNLTREVSLSSACCAMAVQAVT